MSPEYYLQFPHVLCLVTQSCPTLCNPMDCTPPGSSVHGDSPGKNIGVGCHAILQECSQPRDWTQFSHTEGDSLPFEPQRSPWVLEWVTYPFSRGFSTQESNQDLLHWKWILYQLSYQGRPQSSHIHLVISHSLRLVFHIHIPQSPASSPHCPISLHSNHTNLFVSWTHWKYFTSVFYLLFLTHNTLSQNIYMTTGNNILSHMLLLPVEDLP